MYLVGKTKRTPLSHMSVLMLGLSCTNAAVNPQSISMMREREIPSTDQCPLLSIIIFLSLSLLL